MFALTTKGSVVYSEVSFQPGDALLFGPETRGLPAAFLGDHPAQLQLYLPMRKESRSLNLSNTVAVVLYEAMKQLRFPDVVIKPRLV